MKKLIQKTVPVIIMFLGLCMLGYPLISEYLFEHRVDSEIHTYSDSLNRYDLNDFKAMLDEAVAYNEALTEAQVTLTDPFLEEAMDKENGLEYKDILSMGDTGVMAYIDIPAIDVYLPVYHGTSSEVLTRGVGHLEGTSFPVGGLGTHAVLTGHTGMNRAKLFTDLCELTPGDVFYIHVFNEVIAYEVSDIFVVLPEDTSRLLIQSEDDLVTLVTCTPYGVNTHRLLVRGQRIPYVKEAYEDDILTGPKETSSKWMSAYRHAILIGLGVTLLLFILLICAGKLRYRKLRYRKRLSP